MGGTIDVGPGSLGAVDLSHERGAPKDARQTTAMPKVATLDEGDEGERGVSSGGLAASAMRRLFDAHYDSVWRLLRRLGVQQSHVDDLAQEVFWIAARKLADIRPGSEHSFLYGVALRVASQEHRRRWGCPAMVDAAALAPLLDVGPSPEEQMEHRQARALLDTVLDRMSTELRTVFVLCELEELEVREAAALEGIPVGTASSRLRRAREEFSAIAKRVRAALVRRGGLP